MTIREPCWVTPQFDKKPLLKTCRNFHFQIATTCCLKVRATPPQTLQLVFEKPEFDFSGYVLDHVEMHECNYNWKTFIEVYLEDYHVAPFHPGLGKFVTCDDLRWEFADWFSAQHVGVHQALANPGSGIYRKLAQRAS